MHSVTRTIHALLLSAAVCFAIMPACAAPKELVDLIGSLTPREQLLVDIALLQAKSSSAEQKRAATDELNKAKEGYVRLRPFLRSATSVFDYPGLLALARPVYEASDDTYTLFVGIPDYWGWDRIEGEYPYEFEVIFDHQGLILHINSIVRRF